jgi:tetratricopeptide (TPR) repeat protein
MKKKMTISIFAFSLLFVLTPRFLQGGDISHVIAFSEDGRYIAFEEYNGQLAVSSEDGNFPVWINIVDSFTKKKIKSIKVSYGEGEAGPYRGMKSKKLSKMNRRLREKTIKDLKSKGYLFNQMANSPEEIDFMAVEKGPESTIEDPAPMKKVTVFIRDKATGYRMVVSEAKERGGLGNEGLGKKPVASHNLKTIVVSYKTAYIREFDEGETVNVIVNSKELARFNNGIGLAYYKKKNFSLASKFFVYAVELNGNYARGIFNAACMFSLQKNVNMTLKYLNRLKSLKTKNAKKYMRLIKKERDFNPVRSHPDFMKFVKNI